MFSVKSAAQMLLLMALVIVSCSAAQSAAAAAAAADVVQAVADVNDHEVYLTNTEVDYLISSIVEQMIKPLMKLLGAQITSIINTIIDQGGHLSNQIKKQLDKLIETIRPTMINIIDELNDVIGAGINIQQKLQMVLEKIFKLLGVITDKNKSVVKLIINYMKQKLLGIFVTDQSDALLINSINEWLVKPIIQLVQRQIASVIRSLLDQAGHATDKLLEYVDVIAEIIRPSVIRILDITGNLHGEVIQLNENVKQAVTRILGGLAEIGGESKEIMNQLIDMVTEAIVNAILGERQSVTAAADDDDDDDSKRMGRRYSILIDVINKVIRPVVTKIDELLTALRAEIEESVDSISEIVSYYVDQLAELLSPYVAKIVRILRQLGLAGGDISSAVRRTLEIVVGHVGGIAEANRQLLMQLINDLVEKIVDKVKQHLPVA